MCSWQRSDDSNLESANWQTTQDCSVADSVFNFHIFLQPFSNRLFFWIIWADYTAGADFGNKKWTSLLHIIVHFFCLFMDTIYIV